MDFDVSERIGLAFIVEIAVLSTILPLSLLLYLVGGSVFGRGRYFRSHLNFYFVSLLFADTIQGIGAVMDAKWISEGGVTDGAFCRAQGAIKQIGDVGVAVSILAITVHTFAVLYAHWSPPASSLLPLCVLGLAWALVAGLVAGGAHASDYYGPTGLWCWITASYPVQRIALEYAWLWLTAFVNIILYIPLFLAVWYRQGSRASWERRAARNMLFYPAIYLITIAPTSVSRFLSFAGHTVPTAATITCAALFSCSGIANVTLFALTRPSLIPSARSTRGTMSRLATMQFSPPANATHRSGSAWRWFDGPVEDDDDEMTSLDRKARSLSMNRPGSSSRGRRHSFS